METGWFLDGTRERLSGEGEACCPPFFLLAHVCLTAYSNVLIDHNDVSSKMALKVIFSDFPGNVELEEPKQSLIT